MNSFFMSACALHGVEWCKRPEEYWKEYRLCMKVYMYDRYRGADKSLAWPGRKQATATEDFEFHVSYL